MQLSTGLCRQEILKVISGRDAPYLNTLIMSGRDQSVTVAALSVGSASVAPKAKIPQTMVDDDDEVL